MAFDNSPATRWRSWEVASPGMYLDVDFGREESLDEVRLITSPDFVRIQLQLESMNSAGSWESVAGNPRQAPEEVPENIRQMATYEMQSRGVRYLLIRDDNFGAEDFAGDPEAWGLKLIGRGYNARLYEATP